MNKLVRVILILVLVVVGVGITAAKLYADINSTSSATTDSSTSSSDYQALLQKIGDLQSKISDLQGQEKTFSSQIAVMDSQIQLTQYRIEATKQQIMNLTLSIQTANSKITTLQSSINDLTKVLLNRIVATYEVGQSQPFQILVSSNNISSFFTRENYLKIAQAHDKQLMYDTVQAKNDYANQKNIYESEKKQVEQLNVQLEAYTTQLGQEKADKQKLLTETQGSEASYQQQLAAARAQLAGFSSFARNQGGASLLSNQTVCDDWGCYYNQRDSQWGNITLNSSVGTPYSIASDGCLLTDMAMIYTHYGHRNVTPITINSNPNNFAAYEPAWLSTKIVADGTPSSRVSTYIDPTLASGNPVIVGMRYSNGDTHFVILVSGSNGNYIMNDPYTSNGHNISFSSHYSLGMIYEVDKVNM